MFRVTLTFLEELAVAWIERTSDKVLLQASNIYCLLERTGTIFSGGLDDADFCSMGQTFLLGYNSSLKFWWK